MIGVPPAIRALIASGPPNACREQHLLGFITVQAHKGMLNLGMNRDQRSHVSTLPVLALCLHLVQLGRLAEQVVILLADDVVGRVVVTVAPMTQGQDSVPNNGNGDEDELVALLILVCHTPELTLTLGANAAVLFSTRRQVPHVRIGG